MSWKEAYKLFALTLIAGLAIGQYATQSTPNPTQVPSLPAPQSSLQWVQYPDGSVRQIWGWKDTGGYVHPTTQAQPSTGAQVEQTGAVNYGVNFRAMANDGAGTTVRASSADAEATAFDIATSASSADKGKPDCPDGNCKFPHPIMDAEYEVEKIVLYGVLAVAVMVAGATAFIVRSRQ